MEKRVIPRTPLQQKMSVQTWKLLSSIECSGNELHIRDCLSPTSLSSPRHRDNTVLPLCATVGAFLPFLPEVLFWNYCQ